MSLDFRRHSTTISARNLDFKDGLKVPVSAAKIARNSAVWASHFAAIQPKRMASRAASWRGFNPSISSPFQHQTMASNPRFHLSTELAKPGARLRFRASLQHQKALDFRRQRRVKRAPKSCSSPSISTPPKQGQTTAFLPRFLPSNQHQALCFHCLFHRISNPKGRLQGRMQSLSFRLHFPAFEDSLVMISPLRL
ncbi:hypothetical protein BJ508DRAFT_160652 [Ascobolus immersus RN42]|uniref:Uncharacterized protein n=1 Tax=Ascobolus immersus RN42 TaxID=1160509 RepID=A0A3N4HWG8_ASCIM|nr:hypothetical protein BJ508DRAFT_160652 [Ascobolus immersus RN42]